MKDETAWETLLFVRG